MTPEQLAQKFHETYERLAPDHGYETRRESAKPWSEVPENNKSLMIAVCSEIQKAMIFDRIEELSEAQIEESEKLKAIGQWIDDAKQLLRDFDAYTSVVTPRSPRAKRLRERTRTLLGGSNASNPNPDSAH